MMPTPSKLQCTHDRAKKHIEKHIDRLDIESENIDDILRKVAVTKEATKLASKVIAVGNLLARAKLSSDELLIGSKILPEILEE